MTTFLAYTPPAAGHVFPLVPGLLALARRGHKVHVRTSPELVDDLKAAGLDAAPVDPLIVARPKGTASRRVDTLEDLMRRGPWESEDLTGAIEETAADVLLVDTNAYGAHTAAELSGLPWATTLPSLLPLPGKGIPPYGLGLPRFAGPLGKARDRVLWKVVERAYAKAMLPPLNAMRERAGLPALGSPLEYLRRPDRVLVLTGEPLEYPRTDAPDHIRFVGAQPWDPPAATPDWLVEPGDPWVLVTCSTHYQGDEALAVAAVEALRTEPVRVLVTLADAFGTFELPHADNVRVERFVPHGPVLAHAAATVCPSGMGIVQKSAAAGVPIVAVPFGRDQPEVARRVRQAGLGVVVPRKRLDPDRLRDAVRTARALRDDVAKVATTLADAAGTRFADAAEELA